MRPFGKTTIIKKLQQNKSQESNTIIVFAAPIQLAALCGPHTPHTPRYATGHTHTHTHTHTHRHTHTLTGVEALWTVSLLLCHTPPCSLRTLKKKTCLCLENARLCVCVCVCVCWCFQTLGVFFISSTQVIFSLCLLLYKRRGVCVCVCVCDICD